MLPRSMAFFVKTFNELTSIQTILITFAASNNL